MALQERSFAEVFGEIPDPSEHLTRQTIKTTLFAQITWKVQ